MRITAVGIRSFGNQHNEFIFNMLLNICIWEPFCKGVLFKSLERLDWLLAHISGGLGD